MYDDEVMILDEKVNYIDTAENLWKVIAMTIEEILSKEENLKIIDFFNGVGASDCESQKEYIEKNLEIFNSCFEQAKLQNEKQGSMYKKLSILLGLLVCIVLI